MPFVEYEATDAKTNLRLALYGPAGSGKTYSALVIARYIAKQEGTTVVVIDTEHASSNRYAKAWPDFRFRVLEFTKPYLIQDLIEAIKYCEAKNYSPIIIDSFTHFYKGEGGALDAVQAAAKKVSGNTHYAWRDVTPLLERLFDTMLSCQSHIIATMRAKDEIVESNEGGTKRYNKIGVRPDTRPGTEYEFDVTLNILLDHTAIVDKTRYFAIDGAVGMIDDEFAKKLYEAYLSQNSGGRRKTRDDLIKDAAQLGVDVQTLTRMFKEQGWGKYDPEKHEYYLEQIRLLKEKA